MPICNRLLICSTLAATIICLLTYYRKKTRRHFSIEKLSLLFSEEVVAIETQDSHTESELCFEIYPTTHLLLRSTQEPSLNFVCITQKIPIGLASSIYSCRANRFYSPLLMETNQSAVIVNASNESGSESDRLLTPSSTVSTNAPEEISFNNLPLGCFDDPKNNIYEGNPEEMDGIMLPKVLIPSDMWAEVVDKDVWHETFCIPAHMGGVLIGRLGKNVRELRNIWQAEFSLNTCPGKQDTLLFKLSCPLKHKSDVLRWVSQRFRMRPSKTPIGNPNQLKRCLPLGEPVSVHVRSLYGAKEFFVTVCDDIYGKYISMQKELDDDYASTNNFRMQLCEPVTSGTVAVVPHSKGYARALILSVCSTWPKMVFYFLLDHGTFGVVELTKLRKIRAKYMHVPFQAIHVSWAHAFPVFSDIPDLHILRTFFSNDRIHAFAVRMETCCRASVAFAEPYSQPYSASGFLDVLVAACNSGLYTATSLAIYPNRQSWLNGTGVPYYPFSYSIIDYPSLVSFIADDGEAVPMCQPSEDNRLISTQQCCNERNIPRKVNTNNAVPRFYPRGQYRNRGNFKPAYSINHNTARQRNVSGAEGYFQSIGWQKENQYNNQPSNMQKALKPQITNAGPKTFSRRPLISRNTRGTGGVNGFKSSTFYQNRGVTSDRM